MTDLMSACKQPTILAIIADTHVRHLNELPPGLMSTLASADMVIHLGDYDSKELLDDLRKLNNFYGIAGNHDDKFLRRELKGMAVLEIGGKRLGLFHGFFIPVAIQKRMKAVFKKHKIDALLMFNPGSVTGHFPASSASFGLITLDGSISGEIVPLEGTHNAARSYLVQLVAVLFQKAMRRLETWPYPDFPQYTTNMRLALKGSLLSLEKLLF
jgi:predicted phosphodiesterase